MLKGQEKLVDVLLAQFNACRAEIQARSAGQAALVNLNISALGVIAGFYFAYKGDARLLFVIPLLSPILGILWADHAIIIGYLGRFIQRRVMPRLSDTLEEQDLPDFETWIRAFERKTVRRFVLMGAPYLMMFAVLPLGALVLACRVVTQHDLLYWALACLGGSLVLLFGIYFAAVLDGRIWGGLETE